MPKSLKEVAKEAKLRLKRGFWENCKQNLEENLNVIREQGANEQRAERFYATRISKSVQGENKDEFYERVKNLLLTEGEVSDAIGRLTDHDYYNTLSYEEKMRYNMSLSERYLKALKRFKEENEFAYLK